MDGPAVTLLNTFSKGFDKDQFEKTAAVFDDRIKNLDVNPDRSYIQVISTGAQEFYGPNNNADGFNEGPRKHVFPHPAPGVEKAAMLRGGLLGYHDQSFMERGAVYKNHVNSKKGGTPSGLVKMAAVNPNMHRGELILELDNDKWDRELEKLASGEAIYFSIGCSCPSDKCSVCGNEARTRSQYCDHLKNAPLSLDKEGNQVYAISDVPLFHDISGVFRPADKIAFGLRKVASGVVTGAELAELEGLATPLDLTKGSLSKQAAEKLDLLHKLAAIEKKILLKTDDGSTKLADALRGVDGDDCDVPDDVVNRMSMEDPGKVFQALSDKKILLPLGLFVKLLLKDDGPGPADVERAKGMMNGAFGRMLDSDNLESKLTDGSYEPRGSVGRGLAEDAERLSPHLSLNDGPMSFRITRAALKPVRRLVIIKTASWSKEAAYLADEYAKYQLAFLGSAGDDLADLTVGLNEAIV